MPETSQQKIYFKCPKCSVELLWNARVAGHRVSCPCGHVFVAPMRAAVLAGENPPEPVREPPPSAELSALYMRPKKRIVDDEDEKGGMVRNWVVPSILIGLGLIVWVSQITWKSEQIPQRIEIAWYQMLVIIVFLVGSTIGGVWLINLLMPLELGHVKPTVYKLVSLPVFAGALGLAVGRLDNDPPYITGMGMGWSILLLCYWALVAYYFKLELWETMIVCFAVSLVQAVLIVAVFA